MTGDPVLSPGARGDPGGSTGDAPACVQGLVQRLNATDLHPGPVIDAMFRQLVKAVTAVGPGASGDEARYTLTRTVSAQGESLLEEHWARRVATGPAALAAFPHRDNYRTLARGEYGALCRALGRRPRGVAFVGSGPLPLTAIDWHLLDRDLRITCVDRDAAALEEGARVAAVACPDPASLQFVHASAEDVDYSNLDAVVVAALVGDDESTKRTLLGTIARTLYPGAVLAARSVPPDGRQWLYPRVNTADPPEGTRLISEWMPPPGVINSLLLLCRDRPVVTGPGSYAPRRIRGSGMSSGRSPGHSA